MKTVVSITPIAVERDSRTFKEASSFARLGYRSIVFEVEPSRSLHGDLPFELVTLGGRPRETAFDAVPEGATERVGPMSEAAVPPTGSAAAPPARRGIPGVFDRLAARAPDGLRDVAGPSWRSVLRVFDDFARWYADMLKHPAVFPWFSFAHYVLHWVRACRATAMTLPAADLYWLHSSLQFPAVWLRRGRRPRFVYDAHDLYWDIRRDGRELPIADRAIWAVWDLVERACVKRAVACMTVGEGVARHEEIRFGRSFAVVRNAHDDRIDEHGMPDIRERLGLAKDAFLVVVSGNYKRGLAARPMIEAAAALPDHVHVAFIGAGYEPFSAARREIGVEDRVHFVPPVPPTQIAPALRGADLSAVLYFPSSTSVRHALPNGFFHAVSAGVPVLYPCDLVDLRELCERHRLGWEIDPQDTTSIVAAISAALDAPDELAARRHHVEDTRGELSWAHEERELERIVSAVLAER